MKKIFFITVLIILAGAGGVVYFKIKRSDTSVTTTPSVTTELSEAVSAPIERPPFPKEFENDLDQDGLTNEEEKNSKTSEVESDTDGDGLLDVDEIKRWKTDPIKKDTDGDGFADMYEIMGGYNPNGPGKLAQ